MDDHARGGRARWLLAAVLLLAWACRPATEGQTAPEPVPTTFPVQQGQPFAEPPAVASENGVLQTTLTAAEGEVEVSGSSVRAGTFNGSFVGPTLRLRPGDRLELTLVNELSEYVNLHFHGLHVSPQGNSDNIFLHVEPGQTQGYSIDLPADHATGTFWYHSHAHPDAEAQVFGGLSGAMVVDGLEERLPTELQGVEQRLLTLKDLQVSDGAVVTQNIDSNADTTRTVNGLVDPAMSIRPGETQLWRLANIGADIWYQVALEGHRLAVIAEDGNPVWSVWDAESLVLPPGKRYDVLVQGAEAGSYALETMPYNQGEDSYPERRLATLTAEGDVQELAPLPTALAPVDDLGLASVSKTRTVVFSEDEDTNVFFIDGKEFDENRVDQSVTLGALEEWTISNVTTEQHPFHLHVNDFQLMSVNGEPHPARGWQDTVPLPINGEVVIRARFVDFTGRFVYHCHILNHEDNGMMGVVEVTAG